MRFNKKLTTDVLLAQAIAEPDHYYEVARGETRVGVQFRIAGLTSWYVNDKLLTEDDVKEVLARWAVEGVI